MREKIVKLLFTPIPGTQSIEQGLLRIIRISSVKVSQWSLSSFIFLLKSLRWFVPSVSVLLAIWMIGGNFLASQQEKEIEQDLEEFVKRFPDTEPNDSALKLRVLMTKFGMFGGSTFEFPFDVYTLSHPDFAVSPSDRQAFEAIREELGDYLDAQISKPNDTVDPIPDKLRQYLMNNRENLEAIRQHILNNEVPQWERDITPIVEGDSTFILPSYLSLVNLQNVILLDVLEKDSRGQVKQAEEMLEVSWRLEQSLRNEYYVISQLYFLIMGRYSTGIIRKLEHLPVEWQKRLLEYDKKKYFLTSLDAEILFEFNFIKNLHLYSDPISIISISDFIEYNSQLPNKTLFLLVKTPALKPYRRFSAINIYNLSKQLSVNWNNSNICFSESSEIDKNLAWWNSMDLLIPFYLFDFQHSRQTKYMLDLELTKKILQVKELAAKTGKWPQSVPNMESKICPGVEWVYQVSPDGKMSISLSEQPEWLTERIEDQDALPLTYSTRRIPDYDKSLN